MKFKDLPVIRTLPPKFLTLCGLEEFAGYLLGVCILSFGVATLAVFLLFIIYFFLSLLS